MNIRFVAMGCIIGSLPGFFWSNPITWGWCACAIFFFICTFIPTSRGERNRIAIKCLEELEKQIKRR